MDSVSTKTNDSSPGKRKSTPRSVGMKKKTASWIHMNPTYTKSKFKSLLSEAFRLKMDLSLENHAEIVSYPFLHCILPDFLKPDSYVRQLENTIHSLPYVQKDNDLYRFSQTSDLNYFPNSEICAFKNFLHKDFFKWLTDITGINFDATIDLSASCYRFGDYLLCHNDQCDRRRIAFIYYLPPEWKYDDGGSLVLFKSVDDVPTEPVELFLPVKNVLMFFEVSSRSYHQVSEVVKVKNRYAISGWFHADPADVIQHPEPILEAYLPIVCKENIENYISSEYTGGFAMRCIRNKVVKVPDLQLKDFLKEEIYDAVRKELISCTQWSFVGPPHKRSFQEVSSDVLPATTKLFNFLNSNVFLEFLSKITGLTLHNDESDSSNNDSNRSRVQPACLISQICKFEDGNYTLLHDASDGVSNHALEAFLFLNCEDWDQSYGGSVIYFNNNSKETVLDILPTQNSFNFVFSQPNVKKFIKYINCTVQGAKLPYYNMFKFKFFERRYYE